MKTLINLLLTLGLALFLTFCNKPKEQKLFDTQRLKQVNLVKISTPSQELTLSKKHDLWLVNNLLPAQPQNIELLFNTLSSLQTIRQVEDHLLVPVRQELLKSTKIELYTDQRLYKAFFIGIMLPDSSGNYFIFSGDLKPVIVSAKNKMDLLKIFVPDQMYWLAKRPFAEFNPQQMNSLTICLEAGQCWCWKNNSDNCNQISKKQALKIYNLLAQIQLKTVLDSTELLLLLDAQEYRPEWKAKLLLSKLGKPLELQCFNPTKPKLAKVLKFSDNKREIVLFSKCIVADSLASILQQ